MAKKKKPANTEELEKAKTAAPGSGTAEAASGGESAPAKKASKKPSSKGKKGNETKPLDPNVVNDDPLFRELYEAYCYLNQTGDTFAKLIGRAKAEPLAKKKDKILRNAAGAIADWYEAHYKKSGPPKLNEDGKPVSSGRQNRSSSEKVILGEVPYLFDEPYKRGAITKYLTKGTESRRSDVSSFVLHMGVALCMSPDVLDDLLGELGILPLHVRNIHHMAIYAVLNRANDPVLCPDPRQIKPFEEVKDLFLAAQGILLQNVQYRNPSQSQSLVSVQDSFNSNSTRRVSAVTKIPTMTGQDLLDWVSTFRDFYTNRHIRLLRAHRCMALLYATLYMGVPVNDDLSLPELRGETTRVSATDIDARRVAPYSLYAFVITFCKKIPRKHFYDNLYNKIADQGHHPTREAMILMWMYSYCFFFLRDVTDARNLTLKKNYPFLIDLNNPDFKGSLTPFAPYYTKAVTKLHVQEYLYKESDGPLNGKLKRPEIRMAFNGKELKEFLNDRLGNFGWGPLTTRSAFDRRIMKLDGLKISLSLSGKASKAVYEETDPATGRKSCRKLDLNALNVPDVPVPLVAIFRIFRELGYARNVNGDEDGALDCSLYELS